MPACSAEGKPPAAISLGVGGVGARGTLRWVPGGGCVAGGGIRRRLTAPVDLKGVFQRREFALHGDVMVKGTFATVIVTRACPLHEPSRAIVAEIEILPITTPNGCA